jgi:HPr kinase/phosphorylase
LPERGAQEASAQVHGALVEVRGLGVLLRGPSGIGKSEIALELVVRGHRLVADDVVRLDLDGEGRPRGRAPELIRHHLELRGIGIVYLPELYGERAVRDEAVVDLICRLESWKDGGEVERVGLERPTEELLGVPLPCVTLPVRPSGSMATLVEVAVRDLERRREGPSAAERLDARLREEARRR